MYFLFSAAACGRDTQDSIRHTRLRTGCCLSAADCPVEYIHFDHTTSLPAPELRCEKSRRHRLISGRSTATGQRHLRTTEEYHSITMCRLGAEILIGWRKKEEKYQLMLCKYMWLGDAGKKKP